MVGAEGFEPPTLCSQSRCATRLRYAPTSFFDCTVERDHPPKPTRSQGEVLIQPDEQPDEHNDRDGEDDADRKYEHGKEGPVLPGVPSRFSEMALQQAVVASICLPGDIEGIPKQRDRADQYAEGYVHAHAHEGDVRNSAHPGGEGYDQGKQAGDDVAQARDEADDSVDAEPHAREGNAKGLVEQDLQSAQRFIAKQPGAARPAARWKHNAFHGFGALLMRFGRGFVRTGHKLFQSGSMLQSKRYVAAIVQRQNA